MSSPIANNSKSNIQKIAVSIHQQGSHKKRVKQLINALVIAITKLDKHKNCIDVGCGDMSLAEGIAERMPETNWTCFDVYPIPLEKQKENRWQKYTFFNGSVLPLTSKSKDVVLFCDVLHHATEKDQIELIKEALRVAKYVVVKDHFEHGFWSRSVLQLMDIYGNWGYGVSIPKKYFSKQSFNYLAGQLNCSITYEREELGLYSHIPLMKHVLRPHWHFIAVLTTI